MPAFRPQDLVRLRGLLHRKRAITLQGPVGSGKTALCDDLSRSLQGDGMAAIAGSQWKVLRPQPGPDFISSLAQELTRPGLLIPGQHKPPATLEGELREILSDPHQEGLIHLFERYQHLKSHNLLIIVDPLRDLLAVQDADWRESILQLLSKAAHYPDVPAYVLLSLRTEQGQFIRETPALKPLIDEAYTLYPLGQPMIRQLIEAELRDIARQHHLHYRVDPRLLDFLSRNLSTSSQQLQRLEREIHDFHELLPNLKDMTLLDMNTYSQYKGISTEVGGYVNLAAPAEEWFLGLSKGQRKLVERFCRALVQPRIKEIPPSSRPLPLKRLAMIAGTKPDKLIPLLQPLRTGKLQLITPGGDDPLAPETMIGLRKAPMDHPWSRLRDWIEDEAELAAFYQQLSARAEAYEAGEAELPAAYPSQRILTWWETNQPSAAWGSLYATNYRQIKNYITALSNV